MQYMPIHDCCHRQPFFVPGAFLSMYFVADSADSGSLQDGHRGAASRRKRPPHSHGASHGSVSMRIGSWIRSGASGGRLESFHPPTNVVMPQRSQYAYAVSLNPLWTIMYSN